MRPSIPRFRQNPFSSILAHLQCTRSPLPIPFKYRHAPRFRNIINSRTMILNLVLPEKYKLSDYLLFTSIYFDEEIKIKSKDEATVVHVDQERILEIGKDLLNLRLYQALVFNNPDVLPSDQIDKVNPLKYNTLATRTEFINQFHRMLDSKNKLNRVSVNATNTRTIKIKEDVRHKVIPMLIGLVHCQYGISGSKDFTDEWVIRGNWSTKNTFRHKGLLEIYSDRRRNF
jgi:hypothetical protein